MIERPKPDDDAEPPARPVSGDDTGGKPRQPSRTNQPTVTPLDEDKNLEDGIEIKET